MDRPQGEDKRSYGSSLGCWTLICDQRGGAWRAYANWVKWTNLRAIRVQACDGGDGLHLYKITLSILLVLRYP